MIDERRWNIISPYAELLEKISGFACGLELDLPFPRSLIRLALVEEFLAETDPDIRERLKVGLMMVDDFRPLEEFKIMKDVLSAMQSGLWIR